jgi:hypothetical protein
MRCFENLPRQVDKEAVETCMGEHMYRDGMTADSWPVAVAAGVFDGSPKATQAYADFAANVETACRDLTFRTSSRTRGSG